MISLIIFDISNTLVYRDIPESCSETMLKMTNSQIPLKEFIKIFENSLQLKKWDSKFDAYANLCKNMGLPVTTENVNLLMSIRDNGENSTNEFPHSVPMLKQLKES